MLMTMLPSANVREKVYKVMNIKGILLKQYTKRLFKAGK